MQTKLKTKQQAGYPQTIYLKSQATLASLLDINPVHSKGNLEKCCHGRLQLLKDFGSYKIYSCKLSFRFESTGDIK